jgi:hypothetical protein
MYACRLHNHLRMKRFEKEGKTWRGGEKILDEFWTSGDEPKSYCEGTMILTAKGEGPEECKSMS